MAEQKEINQLAAIPLEEKEIEDNELSVTPKGIQIPMLYAFDQVLTNFSFLKIRANSCSP